MNKPMNGRKKILIVEDDQNIAKALTIRLESAGYEVTVAPDTTTGVTSALKIQPDLALLDISMPSGNRFTDADRTRELVATAAVIFQRPCEADELHAVIKCALSENEGGFAVANKIQDLIVAATPIIFLTASKRPGLRRRAQQLGAAAFFEKPYDADELLAAIQRTLNAKEVTKP